MPLLSPLSQPPSHAPHLLHLDTRDPTTEHARHFKEVAKSAYSDSKDDAHIYGTVKPADELPTSTPPPAASGPSSGSVGGGRPGSGVGGMGGNVNGNTQ